MNGNNKNNKLYRQELFERQINLVMHFNSWEGDIAKYGTVPGVCDKFHITVLEKIVLVLSKMLIFVTKMSNMSIQMTCK